MYAAVAVAAAWCDVDCLQLCSSTRISLGERARAPKHSPNVRTYAATPPISTDLSLWKIKLIFMIRFFLVLILSSARSLCLSFCLFIYVYLFLFSPSHWIKILSSSLNYGTNKYTEQLQSFYCCFFLLFYFGCIWSLWCFTDDDLENIQRKL